MHHMNNVGLLFFFVVIVLVVALVGRGSRDL